MSEVLSNPIVMGAVGGFIAAARVDYIAFKSWKSTEEASKFDWKMAVLRWAQGAAGGGAAAAGLGMVP